MHQSINEIFTRRSVRSFTDQKVEQEKIEEMLRAGMQAPSAANQQPWSFIVVSGKERLKELSSYSPYAASLKSCSHAIILLGDTKKMKMVDLWQHDMGAVAQNILLTATAQGLGAVWLCCAPDATRMGNIAALYQLDETQLPYCVIALGYPKKENANHFVDRYDETCVCYIGDE